MQKNIQLTQFLCSKLLHDFSGPIGAINNCLDLCDNKDEKIRVQAKEIILSEVKNFIDELKIEKFIFSYETQDKLLSKAEIHSYFQLLQSESEVSLNFQEETECSAALVKILLCLCKIELAQAQSIYRKEVEVIFHQDKAQIKIHGKRNRNNKLLTEFLQKEQQEIDINNCYLNYLVSLAKECDYKISLNAGEDKVEYILQR